MRSHSERRAAGSRPRRRLVEEDDLRIVDEGEGDRQALPLTARQLARLGPLALVEIEEPDELFRRQGVSIEAAEQVEDLDHRELRVERRGLEGDPDPFLEGPRIAGGVDPEDLEAAGVGGPQPLEHLHGRRLAGAVRAEEAEDLAGADLERDTVDGLHVAVCLADVTDPDDGGRPPDGGHSRLRR